MQSHHAFIAVQIGSDTSEYRRRADQMMKHVIQPALSTFDLTPWRSDQENKPGIITNQILQQLVNARVVIADVTARNANVYYELAIAHAWNKPVIMMADETKDLAFDVMGERTVILGKWEGSISADAAESARGKLKDTLAEVLDPNFKPESVVTNAIGEAQRIESIEEREPAVARELAALRESIESVKADHVRVQQDEFRRLVAFIEVCIRNNRVYDPRTMLDDGEVSPIMESWVEDLLGMRPPTPAEPPTSDDVPF